MVRDRRDFVLIMWFVMMTIILSFSLSVIIEVGNNLFSNQLFSATIAAALVWIILSYMVIYFVTFFKESTKN